MVSASAPSVYSVQALSLLAEVSTRLTIILKAVNLWEAVFSGASACGLRVPGGLVGLGLQLHREVPVRLFTP